jgi:hypothetical protein
MNIEFLSTVAVIARDPPVSRKLYVDALLRERGGLMVAPRRLRTGGRGRAAAQSRGRRGAGDFAVTVAAGMCDVMAR